MGGRVLSYLEWSGKTLLARKLYNNGGIALSFCGRRPLFWVDMLNLRGMYRKVKPESHFLFSFFYKLNNNKDIRVRILPSFFCVYNSACS